MIHANYRIFNTKGIYLTNQDMFGWTSTNHNPHQWMIVCWRYSNFARFFPDAVHLVEERYKILHNRLGRHFATEDDLIHKAKSKKDVRNYLLKNEVLSKDVQAH
jgi:hypothetical protein